MYNHGAEQSRAEQSRAEQSRAEQSRAEQSRAEQSRAEQSRAEQGLRSNLEYNDSVEANTAFLSDLKNKLPEFFTADRLNENGQLIESGFFDWDKFKQQFAANNVQAELSNGNQLNFIGKNYARQQSGERPSTVIVPDQEHNSKPENANSHNLFFTGDNLEVLRHLQANYQNSVDFIYIDPPYNTGSDGFVYPDKFEYGDDQLKNMFGLNDDELRRLKSIQGKATHSAWLTFMYPRLYLAKKLLKDTGVIFVSIDDNEQANLKLLMDEVFGEGSFVADSVVKRKNAPNNMGNIPSVHDYLLIFAKNQVLIEDKLGLPIRTDGYDNPDNDQRGPWKTMALTANHEGPYFEIENPINGQKYLPSRGRYWVFNAEEIKRRIDDGRIIFGKNGKSAPVQKVFLNERLASGKLRKVGSLVESAGINNSAATEIVELFGEKIFDTPKPTSLIKYIVTIFNNKNAHILDFFAGSATTADAVMQLNQEDGGNRKYMMVQLPEYLSETSAAYKSGYKTIDEISRERIKRSAKKIGDTSGFKHYNIVSPTVELLDKLEYSDNLKLDLFDDMVTSFSSQTLDVAGGATGLDTILQTWLVSDGYRFDVARRDVDFSGYIAPYVDGTRVYIINKGWEANNTKALVNMIGTNQLVVQTVVVYGYELNMESLRELEIALNQLESNVSLLVRY
ncbi:site-specific DNA-methyltransferase [Leuconostoc kimchii]|uniref:site-specific DNA-methyltransferase n=1 Tax=Leuconostoc kimchii TaxID=136609 RepID=UPI001FA9DC5C|nr:site-specific DNA-methyltransferase [Leuconostoc kimchii]